MRNRQAASAGLCNFFLASVGLPDGLPNGLAEGLPEGLPEISHERLPEGTSRKPEMGARRWSPGFAASMSRVTARPG